MRARGAEAMNLGDGLKLETQILNGKTKLILAPYDAQEKTSKQVGNRGKAQRTALKGKHQPQVLHTVQNNNERAEQPVLKSRFGKVGLGSGKPPTNVLKELENKKHAPLIQQNAQQTKADAGKAKPMPTKFSNVPKQRPQDKPGITAEDLRESLVCLTQKQFQQILMTINQSNKPNAQEQTADEDNKETEEEESVAQLLHPEEDAGEERDESPSATQPKDVKAGNLFSTLGEREKEKSLQETKKAQWKRELDEQVALKKKLKEADLEGINLRHREGIESSVSERTPYSNTPLNDYSTPDSMLPSTETTDSSPIERASSFSSPELPAAIRCAFVMGEAAPLDHPFSAVKRQQQKKWLEELNKQREEDALRKMQEKKKIQEAEQQDLWAMHFDSFKKVVDNQTPVYQNTADVQLSANPSSSLEPGLAEYQRTPALTDVQQEQPETRMSTEEEYFHSQKAGFLRTMTALLDPAQIDERDRRRQKQLEHQKAIAAQVEEKRKRKQLEDEQRQQEEQEEERRLAKEQEQIQKQYEQDIFRQKQKEDVVNLKTRELYQSMQRAQEEAQRLKQEQLLRHLLKKGHDISNLQKNAEGEAVHLDTSRAASRTSENIPEGSRNGSNSVMKPSVTALLSPRRDTAVQTDDLDTRLKPESVSNGASWRQHQNASPDIPVEFTYQQTKAEQPGKKVKSQRDRSESTKENIIDDIYDQYARTEKQTREPGRKPDWNRNRPPKKYVPASERYPRGLQKQREESKVRRQMELLHLVDRNSSNNLSTRKGISPERSPVPREDAKISHPPEEIRPALEAQKEEKFQKVDPYFKRKPNVTPVPPISTQMNLSPELDKPEPQRPPSSQFVPYVRTKEIYYLDPDAPMSRPSTHDPQYKRAAGDQESRQIFSSDHARDPLLNPNVIRNKDRQQAILRGLSELRKGLLQKQRELETGLMPDV
ncbi:PREDICTED: coiled-coil domain-containing protein 66 [Nanorana parkeri]|uniref:coiled-coil domain-containing protein 66 n=1 Tax=Nanorana parkeri TaxID=125878 RepID=UPI00085406E8|nr:PREDICTED: coiled-coil domain-containing protein 66 [Nanorana parkeri]